MHRTPQLKDQARILREAYAGNGVKLSVGDSLELVAKMNGYVSWNVASAAQRPQGADSSERRITVEVVSWSVVHHHKHGEDVFNIYQDKCPDEEEAIALINHQGGGYEPEHGESFEVLGCDRQTLTLSLSDLEAKVVPASPFENHVVRVFEVDMTEHFEYDVPEELNAWKWVVSKGRFAHRGNDIEPGVYEFMVYTETGRNDDSCPAELKKFFEQAYRADCPWVLFNQG